jgi:branched-chain amino acid transport system ATP-binding protein
VLDNIVIGFHRHEKTSLIENLIGLPAVWKERDAFRQQALKLLDVFGMSGFARHTAGMLSYGHQRRVEMMRSLAMAPAFLLLDEPVAGMNTAETSELGAIFRELVRDGLGILLIEHNVAFVNELCEFVYVIDAGRLIAKGTTDEVCRDPAVITAYLGG